MIAAALCQSCLRVRAFATWEERDDALCECGEGTFNFCNCDGCLATIERLRGGARGRGILGLQGHVNLIDWSEAGGSVLADKKD